VDSHIHCNFSVQFTQSSKGDTSVESIKVLLADDDEMVADVTKAMLEQLGFDVLTASNGHETLNIYQENPDTRLLIIDFHMPDMTGVECIKTIREVSDVSILITTGAESDLPNEEIRNLNCQGFLKKPYTIESLREKTNKILSN